MIPADLPEWLRPVAEGAAAIRGEQLSRWLPPPEGGRQSAVLVLFGEGDDGPDLLLIERSSTMNSHAGQPAFPGGAVDDTDADVIAAALREAEEETGLDPAGVHVLATLPELYLPPSGFVVTPVIGWWRAPSPVRVVDRGEVERVERVPLAELLDPANRYSVRHPSGYVGPAFGVRGLVVWGFTAGLLSRLFALVGWEQPWDEDDVRELGHW
ncbi:NUDIX hydrolase [Longivirga aurantiaca]|uniref:NUDIX hydrolase n=1 Tax=Longivirga aurantiaca TaxID=1837743 RepID=A0ABW1T3X9_9ACTN